MGTARLVAEAINRRVADLLDAKVVRLYWRQDSDGGDILEPVAYYVTNSEEDPPDRFTLFDEPDGILSWVWHRRVPVWIKNISQLDLSMPARNELAPDKSNTIPPEYLGFKYSVESILILPVRSRRRMRGLYAVDMASSARLNKQIVGLLNSLLRPMGELFYNADHTNYDLMKTERSVSAFLNSIRNYSFDRIALETDVRTGFISRRFSHGAEFIDKAVDRILRQQGIRAQRYSPEGSGGFIVDEIRDQIVRSHFCIADITGLPPNVMAEIGMMMMLKKQVLFLREAEDDNSEDLPFNIRSYPCYLYKMKDGSSIQVKMAGSDHFEEFDKVLERFVADLPADTGFASAQALR